MSAVIVVPFYKVELNEAELISLKQVLTVFNKQKIYFAIPDSYLVYNKVAHIVQKVKGNHDIEKFDVSFFTNVQTYSSLMMSPKFYERFINYEYMLIVQLDAFVFFDRLEYFTSLNYDYIGAEVPEVFWPYITHRVGNGGFSLRKISTCLRMCYLKDEILTSAQAGLSPELFNALANTEDQFFSYCGNCKDLSFSLSPLDVAHKFSVEYNINNLYRKVNEKLPFGCHRWYQQSLKFWWNHIQKYGYSLTDDFLTSWDNNVTLYDWKTLEKALVVDGQKYQFYNLKKIINEREILIWGFGVRGKRLAELLDYYNIKNFMVHDKNNLSGEWEDRNRSLQYVYSKKTFIIITPKLYSIEIVNQLDNNGFLAVKDYMLLSDFIVLLFNMVFDGCYAKYENRG